MPKITLEFTLGEIHDILTEHIKKTHVNRALEDPIEIEFLTGVPKTNNEVPFFDGAIVHINCK